MQSLVYSDNVLQQLFAKYNGEKIGCINVSKNAA